MLLIKLELKLYKNIPTNGLVLFCGVISMDDGKTEKKITLDLEPFKPINVFSYKCQNKFHTEPLEALLEDDEKFGFMIVDGNGVLYATLQGNNKEVLQRVMVSLPKSTAAVVSLPSVSPVSERKSATTTSANVASSSHSISLQTTNQMSRG